MKPLLLFSIPITAFLPPHPPCLTTHLASSPPVQKPAWFPIHPADALSDYHALVKSAYIRHLRVETEEMADLILALYNGGSGVDTSNDDSPWKEIQKFENTYSDVNDESESIDLFHQLARQCSTCSITREEGGEIGWVDNPHYTQSQNDDDRIHNEAISEIVSPQVVSALFHRRVKGGDVLKLPIFTDTDLHTHKDDASSKDDTVGWHILRVDDLHLRPITTSTTSDNVVNVVRPKLKGSGVTPLSPSFHKMTVPARTSSTTQIAIDSTASTTATTTIENQIESSPTNNDIMYTVPNAKYYKIVTTGCQMNVADSERITGVLEEELGLSSLEEQDNNNDDDFLQSQKKSEKGTPDILLLNTCTIRDHAEQKVYDALGPYAALKRAGRPIAIVVAGCVAQQEGEALLRRFPEIDLVLGPQYIPWLSDLLIEVGKGSQLCMTESMLWSESGASANLGKGWNSSREKDGDWMVPIKRGHSVRGWVNVIYGCNEHCTYCVVPSVRGVEQSRSMEAILQECIQLASAGYKEVTLLGQNIDAYGRDMTPRRTFADLLHYLNENLPDGTISRIRYVTSHPRYFSDRVIDAVANLDKVCECFHMPFQAGDDGVLRDMRRGYTYESYMNIIRKIRAKAPEASICGDVIVGFPGETEEAFQRTLDLMEEVKFDNLNTFAYSPRPNTEAANWENQISPDVQSERLQRVQSLAAKHALERSQRYVGTEVEVLVEDRNPKNRMEVMGRTRQGRQVFFEGDIDELKGQLLMVEIVEARTWSLVGKLLDHKSG